jgi:hypothetical protein
VLLLLKKFNCLFITILLLSSACGLVIAQPLTELSDSKQRYVYDVFYKKISVGQMVREFDYRSGQVAAKTSANLSFLFYRIGGYQLSDVYWDDTSQLFLSKAFVRKEVGSRGKKTQGEFFSAGHKTKITRKRKTYQFANEENSIVDFHAIGMQMSEGLRSGQTHFDFYMQTTEKVKHYFFEVKGKETIKTELGTFETYRLEQTRKNNRKLIIWFAPEINYQMVKFYYKFNLLDLRGILTKYKL